MKTEYNNRKKDIRVRDNAGKNKMKRTINGHAPREDFGNTTRMRYFKVISAPQTHKPPSTFIPFQLPPPISAFIHGQKCLSLAPYTRGPRSSTYP